MRARRGVAAVVLLAVSSCGQTDGGDVAPTVVTIKAFQFAPDPITVKPGTTITFENQDKINHSVSAGTRETPTDDWPEGVMAGQGETFELTLDEPGTYEYFCHFHPGEGMTGRIVVDRG